MSTRFSGLRQGHPAPVRHSMLPVLLASILAVGLFAARVYRSQQITFCFLVWNLVLAWIPYLSSLWADHLHRHHPRRWWLLLLPGLSWLAFFPNAPYIVTDFWHLQARPPIPVWYDIGMLAAFALAGLFLAVFSLRTIHELIRQHLGSLLGWLFAGTVVGLGGLGIYLGRFLRWNSWDLFLHPRGVLADVATRLANPLAHPRAVGVTCLFAAILFVCYVALGPREPA
jgi:uncharacterized membrane protein